MLCTCSRAPSGSGGLIRLNSKRIAFEVLALLGSGCLSLPSLKGHAAR